MNLTLLFYFQLMILVTELNIYIYIYITERLIIIKDKDWIIMKILCVILKSSM